MCRWISRLVSLLRAWAQAADLRRFPSSAHPQSTILLILLLLFLIRDTLLNIMLADRRVKSEPKTPTPSSGSKQTDTKQKSLCEVLRVSADLLYKVLEAFYTCPHIPATIIYSASVRWAFFTSAIRKYSHYQHHAVLQCDRSDNTKQIQEV